MIVTIKSDKLTVKVNSVGAELWEIIDSEGKSRLWDGNPEIWAKRSPTLFPIIGMVKNGRAQINGKTYPLDKHGILRTAEFTVENQSENSVTLLLCSDDFTKEHYPYDFELRITYTVIDATVKVAWEVKNNNDVDMPFQMGGHPAFTTNLTSDESFEDYTFIFDREEELVSLRIDKNGEVRSDVTDFGKRSVLPLKYSYFDDDALIFKGLKSDSITLVSRVSSKGVRVNIAGIPYLGLWTMKGANAPYICIEPWYGVNSKQTDSELFLSKEGLVFAAPHTVWNGGYSFEIF